MRTAKKINEAHLRQCVTKAEENGSLPNQSALWTAVMEIYNKSLPFGYKEITPSVVRSRVLELNLPLKTISGHKKSANVDLKVLQSCICEVEQNPCTNRSDLFQKVSDVYNKRTDQSCSWATLANIALKNDLEMKTPKGKKGQGLRRGKRTTKAEKFQKNPAIVEAIEKMQQSIPRSLQKRYLPVIEKVREGSRTAAVKLKCLDCSGWQPKEVRNCLCHDCPLWAFRPYQGGAEDDGVVEESVAASA